jgi:hypothetical protein
VLLLLRNPSRIFKGGHNTCFLLVGLQLGDSGLIVLPSPLTCPQGLGSPCTWRYLVPQMMQIRRGGGDGESSGNSLSAAGAIQRCDFFNSHRFQRLRGRLGIRLLGFLPTPPTG